MQDTRVIWSDQYKLACVSVEDANRTHPDSLIAECDAAGAVRYDDGVEYCVELRHDVGPELWTEEALRRSVGKQI